MKTYSVEVVDSLSLLSLKVASNVFDLSTGLHHVSIRDQIVRAQLAVRDLKKGDPRLQSIVIVGAGVAGIAAALEAAKHEIRHVTVLEISYGPFSLLKTVRSRFVGPFMYEWPSVFAQNQSYPNHDATPWKDELSPLSWTAKTPIAARELAMSLRKSLAVQLLKVAREGKTKLRICVGVTPTYIEQSVRKFARSESARAMSRLQRRTPSPSAKLALGYCRSWPSRTREEVTVSPEYVFLAAGMGKETVKLVKEDAASHPYTGPNFYGPAFWGDDSLKETPSVNRKIGIFGGGDGALQDVLRALTRFNHPLEFMRFLEKDAHVKIALSRVTPGLLAAERQGRQFGAWTIENGGYLAIDRVCKEVAEKLSADSRLVRKICQGISFGRGSVALYVRGKHFDKAYLLNRFLIHLIWACYGAQKSMWSGRVGFQVVFGHQAVGYVPGPNNTHEVTIGLTASGRAIREVFDTIAVRYGITAGTPPGSQLIQVSTKRSRQRTSLARVELPFVVDKT